MIAPPERMPERDAAILAMLPNVAFDGWTKRALRAGIIAAGMPADEADHAAGQGQVMVGARDHRGLLSVERPAATTRNP